MIILNKQSVRAQRELDTVKAMIRLYCKTLHRGAIVCPECESLFEYVEKKVDSCRLAEEKPACLKCHRHCYHPAKRLQMAHVMRWALPRFTWRHPLRALQYKFDRKRQNDSLPSRNITEYLKQLLML